LSHPPTRLFCHVNLSPCGKLRLHFVERGQSNLSQGARARALKDNEENQAPVNSDSWLRGCTHSFHVLPYVADTHPRWIQKFLDCSFEFLAGHLLFDH
jgi:hypothetical protein